jgi:ABC-type antimicrobial peptide transport system permease subunit
MDERVAASLALRRFTLALLSTLALVALLLALAGIYGVTAYLVAQRTRELGVRLALGATPLGLVAFIAGDTMRAVGLGALCGAAASALVARLLRGLLFGVQPIDPLTYATLAIALGVVAGLATLAAALRALRLSPAEALRD